MFKASGKSLISLTSERGDKGPASLSDGTLAGDTYSDLTELETTDELDYLGVGSGLDSLSSSSELDSYLYCYYCGAGSLTLSEGKSGS